MTDLSTSTAEDPKQPVKKPLPGQSRMAKFLEWGAVLVTTITAGFVQGGPMKFDNADFSFPTAFGGIIVGIMLMAFLSKGSQFRRKFTLSLTIILGAIAIVIFLVNSVVIGYFTVEYNPYTFTPLPPDKSKTSVERTYLKGFSRTPEAQAYHDTTRPKPTDAKILFAFYSNPDSVWTSGSVAISKVLLYILYFIFLISVSLSIISAFEVGGSRKRTGQPKRAARRQLKKEPLSTEQL